VKECSCFSLEKPTPTSREELQQFFNPNEVIPEYYPFELTTCTVPLKNCDSNHVTCRIMPVSTYSYSYSYSSYSSLVSIIFLIFL
jgi:hypothetical protein